MQTQEPKRKSDGSVLHLYNLYIGGLMALILVVLQAVLGLDRPDPWIVISVVAFAVALPLLGGILLVNLVEERYPYGRVRSARAVLLHRSFILGIVATLVGMDAAFWHISWLAAVAFPLMMVATALVCGWYIADLDKDAGKPDE